MSKSKLFYTLDAVIAIAFVLSIASGLVFWLSGSGGQTLALGLTRDTWRDLHIWVSLVMGGGALLHIALHWRWITHITRCILGLGARPLRSFKTRLLYALDWVIGIAFILSMLSGLAFYPLGSGGYQGGRNPDFRPAYLGLNRGNWSDLHTWVSLVMLAGILTHIALHWQWIVLTSKRLFRRESKVRAGAAAASSCCTVES